MPSSEFLLFSAGFPDAKFEEKIEGRQTLEKMAFFLKSARGICWAKMFDFAPIDQGEIEKLAFSYGKPKSIRELSSILSSIKPGALESQLRSFVTMKLPSEEEIAAGGLKKPKGDPVDFAFAFFLFCLWKSVFPQSASFTSKGSPKREVRLAANCEGWVAVKKVDLVKAEKNEVLFALSGIFSSLNKKLPEFASSNSEGFENFVSSFLNGFPVRKSFVKLPALLNEALAREEKLKEFASDAGSLELLRQDFFLRCFEHAGFPPFVSLGAIAGVYPDLKVPKPRGNFGGKKKK
ncbi:MAG: hypothetical protein V1717_02670 [Candidatus Micrarchaeota archaeon]